MDSLTGIEQQMLDTEAEWWATEAGKNAAIADRFGMSAVRYYDLLNRLIESEAALAYDAVTVNRLRRLRSARSSRRRSIWSMADALPSPSTGV
jgi:hypothetical protein